MSYVSVSKKKDFHDCEKGGGKLACTAVCHDVFFYTLYFYTIFKSWNLLKKHKMGTLYENAAALEDTHLIWWTQTAEASY